MLCAKTMDTLQNIVGPGFFNTLGIRMLAGRDMSAADRLGGQDVCVLNQSAAAHFFPGLAPIGRQIDRRQSNSQRAVRCEVVGLVEDAKYWTLEPRPATHGVSSLRPGTAADGSRLLRRVLISR